MALKQQGRGGRGPQAVFRVRMDLEAVTCSAAPYLWQGKASGSSRWSQPDLPVVIRPTVLPDLLRHNPRIRDRRSAEAVAEAVGQGVRGTP